MICNYLINYKLPCPVLHIPAFADFPRQYATLPFEPQEPKGGIETFCLYHIVNEFIADRGLDFHLVTSERNHMGVPLTKTDAVPYVMEYVNQYVNQSIQKRNK